MNIPIDTPSSALRDIFFRAADRMRVEGCVNAVANEGLSLALSCVHEALLDHYVQQLLMRLRTSAPDHNVEVYFPTNTESLISRFNEVLASQSLREATRNGAGKSSAQIWVVHDAQMLPEQELQLLARLIQNFPGANIRAILLMVGEAPSQESLSAFGRKLLRWEIEPPTEEQSQAALELARLQGQEDALLLLLRRMARARQASTSWLDEAEPSKPASPASTAPSGSPALAGASAPLAQDKAAHEAGPARPAGRWAQLGSALGAWTARAKAAAQARQAPPTSEPSKPSALARPALGQATPGERQSLAQRLMALRQRSPLLLAAVGALGLSVLLMMWMQPASFGLKGKGQRADSPAVAAAESASAARAMAAQTPVVSVSAAPESPPPTDVPDPAAEAQAWLRAMPPQNFVIQHGAMASYEKAQQMLKSYASLREARIVAAYRPGEKLAYFVVVSGPYEAAGKAYERFARKDLPNTSWVRTAQSLQVQLEPSAKETR